MRIGFISTRLAGTDGVSLETQKMVHVARRLGHEVFYCAGELAGDVPGSSMPEIHFRDPVAVELGSRAFGGTRPDAALEEALDGRAQELVVPLRAFLEDFDIDFVVPQNIFAIPMQLPLAQALAEVLEETGLPGLSHNHDYYWERDRYLVNRIPEFLDRYFPPDLPCLAHASINSIARRDLLARRGIDSILLPNVFDFAVPAPAVDHYNADFRQAIGLEPSDWLILQPTRVIPRKGIELAVDLVARLEDPRAKLVITHDARDEGLEYLGRLQAQAAASGVDLLYVADLVDDYRAEGPKGEKIYALWDTYPHADLVTYPSLYEGFGNALVEAIYFHKPALVNRYSVYEKDIGPLGFEFAEIDGSVTDEAVEMVRGWLEHPRLTDSIVRHNYRLGAEHFSYETLESLLEPVFGTA